jgi:hypothetical protein
MMNFRNKTAYENWKRGMFANTTNNNSVKRRVAKAQQKSKSKRRMQHKGGVGKVSSTRKKVCEKCKRENLPLDKGKCKFCAEAFKEYEEERGQHKDQRLAALNEFLFDAGMTTADIEKIESQYNIQFDPDDLTIIPIYTIDTIDTIGYEVVSSEGDFLIFKEFEDAKHYAVDRVEEDLESMPESFNQNFLADHLYITDTDARIIAGEEAESDRERWDEDTTEELRSQLKSQDYSKYVTLAEKMDREQLIEEIISNESDRIEGEISESPIQYFVRDNGYYTMEQLMEQNWININEEEAARDAVDQDGVAHYLARYDHEELETPNGFYVYRTN